MVVGNLVALAQRNVKRLMAYSSIAHAGFILAGVAALTQDSQLASNGIMLYLVGYSITNLVVFAALIAGIIGFFVFITSFFTGKAYLPLLYFARYFIRPEQMCVPAVG